MSNLPEIDIDDLYKRTTFSKEDSPPRWSKIIHEFQDGELWIYVRQGACFGNTMITLDDSYENSGDDCFFIQELVKLYREGKLVKKENDEKNNNGSDQKET